MLKLPCNPTFNVEINEENNQKINIRTYEKNTKYNKEMCI
jgi:hypothetical protein